MVCMYMYMYAYGMFIWVFVNANYAPYIHACMYSMTMYLQTSESGATGDQTLGGGGSSQESHCQTEDDLYCH